jgi:hypothetical protein
MSAACCQRSLRGQVDRADRVHAERGRAAPVGLQVDVTAVAYASTLR